MISFVVPAYNEELELPSTIAAIRSAGTGYAYEIIVVDDASIDQTAEAVRIAGARLVSIDRRQIAAARNAGARAARGHVLLFVDADTRINQKHVSGAMTALEDSYAGGRARVMVGGAIPMWSRVSLKLFCAVYFRLNLGAGAFLFTTRENFESVGGFDERLFVGEEVYFSRSLRKLGRFRVLSEPVVTSGRKFRMYSAREILANTFSLILRGLRAARSREGLEIWYDGRRETSPPIGRTRPAARSTTMP